jgi:hypothetical protein
MWVKEFYDSSCEIHNQINEKWFSTQIYIDRKLLELLLKFPFANPNLKNAADFIVVERFGCGKKFFVRTYFLERIVT